MLSLRPSLSSPLYQCPLFPHISPSFSSCYLGPLFPLLLLCPWRGNDNLSVILFSLSYGSFSLTFLSVSSCSPSSHCVALCPRSHYLPVSELTRIFLVETVLSYILFLTSPGAVLSKLPVDSRQGLKMTRHLKTLRVKRRQAHVHFVL